VRPVRPKPWKHGGWAAKPFDNWCSDVGRNSQPARWAADSTFPTV